MASIHVGDIGTEFQFTILDGTTPVDISAATIQFTLKKPSGTIVALSGTLVNTGTDGKCKWVTVDGDLNEAGIHRIQSIITIGSNVFHTDAYQFTVSSNIS